MMSNQLKMAQVQSILALSVRGWSQRRIARELGMDRETVARYVGLAAANPAKLPTGSDGSEVREEGSNPAKVPTGSDEELLASGGELLPTSLSVPTVKRRSDCDPWRAVIKANVALGLSAKRIHQDLVSEQHATIGSDSVRRFIQRLGASRPLPMRRLECAAGDEVQVDFGTGAPIVLLDGKKRKTSVFRMVLSRLTASRCFSRRRMSSCAVWRMRSGSLAA